jgi:pyroglutamyl-peptidase
MTTILLTGFGDFPGAPINPTTALVARLARTARRRGVRCIAHVFATRYAAVDRELPALIATHRPDAIVMFGLAGRRRRVSIETCARNRMSTLFPDAGGAVPLRAAIAHGAPARARGRAPFAWLLAAARQTRVKTALSHDAGTYLCNYVYWRALEAAARPGGPRLAVFVHVPRVGQKFRPCARGGRRAFTLDQLAQVGEAVVAAVSRH